MKQGSSIFNRNQSVQSLLSRFMTQRPISFEATYLQPRRLAKMTLIKIQLILQYFTIFVLSYLTFWVSLYYWNSYQILGGLSPILVILTGSCWVENRCQICLMEGGQRSFVFWVKVLSRETENRLAILLCLPVFMKNFLRSSVSSTMTSSSLMTTDSFISSYLLKWVSNLSNILPPPYSLGVKIFRF